MPASSGPKNPRRPRKVTLDKNTRSTNNDAGSTPRKPRQNKILSELKPDISAEFENPQNSLEISPPKTNRSFFSWGTLFFATLGGLVALGSGLAIDRLIQELFTRHLWLGWTATVLTVIFILALAGLILREIWGISRLNTIDALRIRAQAISNGEESAQGRNIVVQLMSLYAQRADLTASRTQYEQASADILDGQDLLRLFETTYMATIDNNAKKLVMQSAKRVSVVTAISPRALVDIAYVLMENIRLIKQISHLYGGRPGIIGFWRLARNILAHLALTGVIAAGDSLIQQFIGHGVAARLSSKLGEGIVNGLLTARIGIAAIEQTRPMPFTALKRPGVSEYFKELTNLVTAGGDKK